MNEKKRILYRDMERIWLDHIMWVQFLISSIAAEDKNTGVIAKRVMQVPKDTAAIFLPYYGKEVAATIESLVTGHLTAGAALFTAVKANDAEKTEQHKVEILNNADDIAKALAGLNPNYQEKTVRDALHGAIGLTFHRAKENIAGNFEEVIKTYAQSEDKTLETADYLAAGLIKQFPDKF